MSELTNRSVESIINERKIILGPKDRIKSATLSKYPWAISTFEQMLNNEWKATTVPVSKDDPSKMSPGCQLALKRAVAFLTNLDGLQLENLTFNIVEHITDYGVQQCLYRQIFEEALHVQAYGIMIDTFWKDPNEVFSLHETDLVLKEKNEFVLAQAQAINGAGDFVEKFYYAVISNIILEGVYFNSGFLLFYVFSKFQNQMTNCSEQIEYIHRDENAHTWLFLNIAKALVNEYGHILNRPEVIKRTAELFEMGAAIEIKWGAHIIEEGVPGLSVPKITDHIRSLADYYLIRLPNMKQVFNVQSPYPWVFDIVQDPNAKEKNFFENTDSAYSKKTLDFGDW